MFFALNFHLLLSEWHAGVAIQSIHREDVVAAHAPDRALQHHACALSLTDLLGDGASDALVGSTFHELESFAGLLIGNQTQKRGLLQLHSQSLFQGIVKHRVTGAVIEIG